MAMRKVEWRDSMGRRWVALVPESMPDAMAKNSLQLGPVSLEPLGLPLPYEVKLHNELVQRGLLTYDDLRARRNEVESAVRSLWRAGAAEIIDLFRIATTET